jgi:hypothetical protein
MKFTIEEIKNLKAKEWVWIVPSGDFEPYYAQVIVHTDKPIDKEFWVNAQTNVVRLYYADYGTKWTAYKNKEQADKPIDVTKKCCDNCRNKGLGSRCEKLNQLFADNGVQYEDGIFPSSNDKWSKRYDIMKENCCDDFDSRWLEYPIAVTEVECRQPKYNDGTNGM